MDIPNTMQSPLAPNFFSVVLFPSIVQLALYCPESCRTTSPRLYVWLVFSLSELLSF